MSDMWIAVIGGVLILVIIMLLLYKRGIGLSYILEGGLELLLITGVLILCIGGYNYYQKNKVLVQCKKIATEVDILLANASLETNSTDPVLLPILTIEDSYLNILEDKADDKVKEEGLPVNVDDNNVSKEDTTGLATDIITVFNTKYNTDTVKAVIDVGNGLIREPVVISSDLSYEHKLPNGKQTIAGTVFIWGKQASPDVSYAVYYGHAMSNKTRFGWFLDYDVKLEDLKTAVLFTKAFGIRNLELIHLSTISESDFQHVSLNDYQGLYEYMTGVHILDSVVYDYIDDITEDDFILTLSTCAVRGGKLRVNAIYKQID